jgi:transcriptional regulator with XRE-family HTH domain
MIQARKNPKGGSPNLSLKALRSAIGRSQSDFAAMLGVSTDTIISWENGRNRLTKEKARLIHVSTGARSAELLEGKGRVLNEDGQPYSAADFKRWHETYLDAPDDAKARYFHAQASRALWVLFMAAAKPSLGRLKNRLPGIWMSFLQWADEADENFRLKEQIEQVRREHKKELGELAGKPDSICRGRVFKV